MTLPEQLLKACEFDGESVVKLSNHEWPFKRYGAMVPDSQSEDGAWDGFASDGPGKGNIVWETESVPIAVLRPDDAIVPMPILQAVAKVVGAAEEASLRREGDRYVWRDMQTRITKAIQELRAVVEGEHGK